jgi:histidine triad (HIT) family protein
MDDCIFCKIVRGEIPSSRVFEDEQYLAFKDINPRAPVHFLVIAKEHSHDLEEMLENRGAVALGGLFEAAVKTAQRSGLKDFRLGVNNGRGAGQIVFHTHVHVLGGWRGSSEELE